MTPTPRLSVIVPAHQAAKVLSRSLPALEASDLPRDEWEMVVVDDGSTDETSVVAAAHADTVVRLPGKPRGPAFARNRGFEASRGEVVAFVDADVCVRPDTLRRLLEALESDPEAAAVFGAYDPHEIQGGLVSHYRNLLHHHVHSRDAGDAETFWAGCGAVRRAAFEAVGMFDEWHYPRPQIEDIDLGRRLRRRGFRILLRPEIQGAHLKVWTLSDMLATDLRHRGVPWTRLLLQEGPNGSAARLNLRLSDKICTGLAGLAVGGVVLGIAQGNPLGFVAAKAALLAIVALNLGFYRFLARVRSPSFALRAIPLHLLYFGTNLVAAPLGWLLHVLFGAPHVPVDVIAQAGMEMKTWPPSPRRPEGSIWGDPPREAARRAREANETRQGPRSVPWQA